MITKEQALTQNHFHENGCKITLGPRGGKRYHMTFWRRNGATKTWVTRPEHFRVPIKHGFYGPCSYITQDNAHEFHTEETCPARVYITDANVTELPYVEGLATANVVVRAR